MTKRIPHDNFIIIHRCEGGYMIEYPDLTDPKRLIREVLAGEDELDSLSKLITSIIEQSGFVVDEEDAEEEVKDEKSGSIGFKLKTKE